MRATGRLIDELMTKGGRFYTYQGKWAVRDLIPILASSLFDDSPGVRQEAAERISIVARTKEIPLSPEDFSQTPVYLIVDELRTALDEEPVPDIKATIVEALARLVSERRSAVEPAVPELCAATDSTNEATRLQAIVALYHILRADRYHYTSPILPYARHPDTDAVEIVETLSGLLHHHDSETRKRAAAALGNAAYHIPAIVDPAIPKLRQALQTSEGEAQKEMTKVVAYLSRAHPLLAIALLSVLDPESNAEYVYGAIENTRAVYPQMINEIDMTFAAETPDTPADAKAQYVFESDDTDEFGVPLLDNLEESADARNVVLACENIAHNARKDNVVTKETCKTLFAVATGDHYVETAPRVALEVIRYHHPELVAGIRAYTHNEFTWTLSDYLMK